MRGNPSSSSTRTSIFGSIPAYAGEPRNRAVATAEAGVYPRVCGGTSTSDRWSGLPAGLSPRMRGNLSRRVRADLVAGSIPAYAGEPGRRRRCPAAPRVYPRVCGGTGVRSRSRSRFWGLSPRMRGNHAVPVHDRRHLGSIPAYAGEPPSRAAWAMTTGVYPRVCGGTTVTSSTRPRNSGLSPRMRGNPRRVCCCLTVNGSIPAYAGEPDVEAVGARGRRVYPRVCGGTGTRMASPYCERGLSPRMRGNRQAGRLWDPLPGSIPAYAGEPDAIKPADGEDGVYPRVCGGTSPFRSTTAHTSGLSPRMRGNPSSH